MISLFGAQALAQEFVGSSLKIIDPVIEPSNYSTSTAFGLWGVLGQLAVGTSTSLGFGVNSGFLFFPEVTTPAVSATAGDTQVNLSWTASTGFLGWTVSGYTVGQATASGGPYSYTSVGNVLAATRSSLTNGTPYYFVIRIQDAFSNFVATSSEVTATPASAGGGGGGGGGSGGGGSGNSQTGVIFEGRAYPLSKVTVLKDGQIAVTTIAGPDSKFSISLTNLSAGDYNFSLYGEDNAGRRSSLFSFPVKITTGVVTKISGIFITPTLAVDKQEVKQGDNLAIFGQTAPNANVTVNVNSPTPLFFSTNSDLAGVYLYNLDTAPLELGQHSAKSKAATSSEISAFGVATAFKVGTQNVLVGPIPVGCSLKADLNCDGRVNLVDFSIAAFWYRRPISAEFAVKEKNQLNGDGKIDLIDFSIMAYYWTG
mgnify:CR=1 FL=1